METKFEQRILDLNHLIILIIAIILLGFVPYLNTVHKDSLEASHEPPTPKISDYPMFENHCRICRQCLNRFVFMDNVDFCDEGSRLFYLDFKKRWDKLENQFKD